MPSLKEKATSAIVNGVEYWKHPDGVLRTYPPRSKLYASANGITVNGVKYWKINGKWGTTPIESKYGSNQDANGGFELWQIVTLCGLAFVLIFIIIRKKVLKK